MQRPFPVAAAGLVLALVLTAGACGKGERPVGEASPAPSPAAAAAPEAAGSAADTAPVPAGDVTTLAWTKPDDWVEETPSTSMRKAQYRVTGPGGDAECQVFYFGPGQGGTSADNVKRWAEQFTNPDGSSAAGTMTNSRRNINGIPVLLVEIKGTWSGGMAMPGAPPAAPMPGAMLMGAIAEGGDSNWFFKLIGPEATVKSRRDSFMSLVRSFRREG